MDVIMVKTIHMTVEESLLIQIDQTAKEMNTSRSALLREAIQKLMHERKIRQMEEQHRRGYQRIPQDDMSDWIAEQVWEDDGEDWSEYYEAG